MQVVNALADAVCLRYPPSQQMVGLDARTAIALTRQLPSWLQEALQRFQFGVWKLPAPAAVVQQRQEQRRRQQQRRRGDDGGSKPSRRGGGTATVKERGKKKKSS